MATLTVAARVAGTASPRRNSSHLFHRPRLDAFPARPYLRGVLALLPVGCQNGDRGRGRLTVSERPDPGVFKGEVRWRSVRSATACWSSALKKRSKTKGGIIIPDTAKEKPQEGEVVSVGPGARDESGKVNALELKAGDRILFGKWSGTEVKIDGDDLIIMKESDVLGVLS